MRIFSTFNVLKFLVPKTSIFITLVLVLTWCITFLGLLSIFDMTNSMSFSAATLLERSIVEKYNWDLISYMLNLSHIETKQIFATYSIILKDPQLFAKFTKILLELSYEAFDLPEPYKLFLVIDDLPRNYTPQVDIERIPGFTNCYFLYLR
jgi:hypothetical protein